MELQRWKSVTLLPPTAAVNPGGSGMPVAFGFPTGGLFRSTTHCGGGGGTFIFLDVRNWL